MASTVLERIDRLKRALDGLRPLPPDAIGRLEQRVLLKEPYEVDAVTPDGKPAKRLITVGAYNTVPNNVRISTGEMYYPLRPNRRSRR